MMGPNKVPRVLVILMGFPPLVLFISGVNE